MPIIDTIARPSLAVGSSNLRSFMAVISTRSCGSATITSLVTSTTSSARSGPKGLSSSCSSIRGLRIRRVAGSCAQGQAVSAAIRWGRALSPRSELAGQYEESFADVEKRLLDFFTFKAVRVIIRNHKEDMESQKEDELKQHQHRQQMVMRQRRRRPRTGNLVAPTVSALPPSTQQTEQEDDDLDGPVLPYSKTRACQDAVWLETFVVNNKVRDSKLFIRSLVQERQELAERIMVTRLHLFNTWSKKYNHATMHAAIKDQNLELLRERLMETVKFQAEDSEGTST